MILINETSRIDAYAGPPARSRMATAPSEMSLRTHLQPDITIVEVGGVVDACNAERPSDHVADLASPGQPLILDLYGANLSGNEGLRAFARIAEACQHKGVRWAVATSEAVDQLPHITDSTYRLPATVSLEAVQHLTPRQRSDAPAVIPVCTIHVVAQPHTSFAQRAPRVEPRTVKEPVDAGVITCYST